MKTDIIISGQISGNSKLRNAIITAECEEKRGMFNSCILTFKTKESAINALSRGYQRMCRETPEEKGTMTGIRYTRGLSLSYDASRAVIQ